MFSTGSECLHSNTFTALLLFSALVNAHNYVKPDSCPDDHIFYDRTMDSAGSTIIVNNEDECAASCDSDSSCMAYNIKPGDSLRCELNNRLAGKYGENIENAANWEYFEKQEETMTYDSCDGIGIPITGAQREIMDSGAPVKIVQRGYDRSWSGKDSLDTQDRWYRANGDWIFGVIYEYASEADFVRDAIFATHDVKPDGLSSNYVVYGRKFWYRSYDIQDVMVWDFDKDAIVGNITDLQGISWFQGPSSADCAYKCGQNSGLDIEVDESGVWLVFGINSYNCWIVIAKVDTDSYRITWHRIFKTSYAYSGNGFIADGIYYGMNSFDIDPTFIRCQLNIRNGSMVIYNFNGKTWQNPSTALAQIHYNPKDKKVYSTNRGGHYRFDNITWQTIQY